MLVAALTLHAQAEDDASKPHEELCRDMASFAAQTLVSASAAVILVPALAAHIRVPD
jgi:hypothetical protein